MSARSSIIALALGTIVTGILPGEGASEVLLATTPFELNSNKIYLEVQVEEQKRWFILDSGAPIVFLDRDFAASLRIDRNGGRNEDAGLGSKPIEMSSAENVALRIGPLELPAQDVGVMPLNEVLRGFEGRSVSGLIGNDVISHYVIEIDYEKNVLRWYDPALFQYSGKGRTVPVSVDQHAFIKASIQPMGADPVEGNFLLDIGVRNGLMLFTPFVQKHGLLERTSHPLFATVGCGIGGEVRSYVGRMAKVEIGDYALEQPIVTMSKDETGLQATDAYDGILGAEFLKRFKLYLDYSHQRIFLEPNGTFDEPFEFDTSGLVVIANGPELRSFRVHRILEGSPAEEAGIRAGDEIVRVDDQPVSKITLETLRSRLVAPGEHRDIEVQRSGKKLRARVTMRRLV